MAKKPFRVLSIDGGGMRGLFVAELLRYLALRKSEQFSMNLSDIGRPFDLITGTSTGGILACALAKGVNIGDVIAVYVEKGEKIFPDTEGYIDTLKNVVNLLRKGRADGTELKEALTSVFGESTLGEIYEKRKIKLCIPALDYTTNTPYIFKTPHNVHHMQDKNIKLVDACMATSAAPIFFQPYFFEMDTVQKGYVDGGMWANNPVLVGLTEALAKCGDNFPIDIISLGIYAPNNPLFAPEKDLGVLDWTVKPMMQGKNNLTNLILDAQSSGAEHTAAKLVEVLNISRKNKIRLIRLPLDQTINESDKRYMDMDSAGIKAEQVMKAYAQQQAALILHAISTDFPFVDDIFKGMAK